MSKPKKVKVIGVWDSRHFVGTVLACFTCAKKHDLDLCGTPNAGETICEYCGATGIQD